jgi:hypothetical protein
VLGATRQSHLNGGDVRSVADSGSLRLIQSGTALAEKIGSLGSELKA